MLTNAHVQLELLAQHISNITILILIILILHAASSIPRGVSFNWSWKIALSDKHSQSCNGMHMAADDALY